MVGLLMAGTSAFAASPVASCTFGSTPSCSGLNILAPNTGDSLFTSTTVDGQTADVFSVNTTPGNNPVAYIYLGVASSSSLLAGNPTTLYATVEYYNKNTTSGVTCSSTALNCALLVNYDSSIGTGVAAAYANATPILNAVNGSGAWTTQVFTLSSIQFTGAENNGADLRLAGSAGIAVHSIQLSVTKPTAASTTTSSSTTSTVASNTASSSTSTTTTKTSTTTATTTAKTSTATTSSLPKTGESTAVPLAGVALVSAGLALTLRRRSPKSSA